MTPTYGVTETPIRKPECTSGPDQPMPVTILDLVLLAVMLISGLLAMVRGFMREILSIAAWGAAALVTLYAFSKLLPTARLISITTRWPRSWWWPAPSSAL